MWKITNNLVEEGKYWTGGNYCQECDSMLIETFRLLAKDGTVIAYGKCDSKKGPNAMEPLTALRQKYGAKAIEYKFTNRVAGGKRVYKKMGVFNNEDELIEA